ncbi:MAG: DUF58 domain-containing protein [Planctomycetes bacterium]|nr:DUF58 domain-containing protein [Planctomycetota bacterium]
MSEKASDKTEPHEKGTIDPSIIGRIAKLELRARLVVEGYVSGLHRSPYRGFSVEFAEHREYAPGDDLRYLDWKVFGKSDRYYVKRYEEETNLLCHLVLDISESMDFGTEGVRKFDYAATIAASLAHLVVEQSDAAGLVLFDDEVRAVLPPGNSAAHLRHIFDVIEKAKPKGKTELGTVLVRVSEQLRKRGLVVVISDLVGDVEEVLRGLRQLRSRKHDVIVLQVLDPAEIEFPFEQMTMFEGLEGIPEFLADPKSLRASYLARLETFRSRLRAGCLAERIDVVEMSTRTPLDVALTSYLSRRAATERAR